MKEKIYNIIELILGGVLLIYGVLIVTGSDLIMGWLQYAMMNFLLIKISLVLLRGIMFKLNKPFMIIEASLNFAILVALFFFKDLDSLSFVVSASCVLDLLANIVKSLIFRKSDNPMLKSSFFGMENIIYILFFVMLIMNANTDLEATGVLFGVIILYKGVALVVGNYIIRSLVNKTDFGQAVNKVRGLDIFFGLATIVVMAAFVFPYLEPTINNPGDALWYCFTVITTIGFGDIAAQSLMGRLLSVVIGCYGIVLVSILTSAFVVYLNNTSKAKDNETKPKETKKKDKE